MEIFMENKFLALSDVSESHKAEKMQLKALKSISSSYFFALMMKNRFSLTIEQKNNLTSVSILWEFSLE